MKTCPTCNQEIQPLNPRTLVSVHGYAGDQIQIEHAMPYFLHHDCPVVVLSPKDSPIVKVDAAPTVICRQEGMRAYTGQVSLDRQILHMKALLDYPFEYFLMNDADSLCVSPKIPDYVYRAPEILWNNEVSDMMHNRLRSYRLPRIALQPPYFISRRNIERILKVAPRIRADQQTPFIDWAMMAWAVAAKIPHKGFNPVASCPTRGYQPGIDHMSALVRQHGAVMLHSIKDKAVLDHMLGQYRMRQEDLKPAEVMI